MHLKELPKYLSEIGVSYFVLGVISAGPKKGWYFCNLSVIEKKRGETKFGSGDGPDPENAVAAASRDWQEWEDRKASKFEVSSVPSFDISLEDL